jgi:hypothetical protein
MIPLTMRRIGVRCVYQTLLHLDRNEMLRRPHLHEEHTKMTGKTFAEPGLPKHADGILPMRPGLYHNRLPRMEADKGRIQSSTKKAWLGC